MHLLDTTKLQTFVIIAREGSFTRAAECLNMTQPTVSQQMAALEKQIGAALFIRRPRHLQLTEAGEALLSYAGRILALSEEAVQSALEAAGLAQRTLSLGVGNTLAIYLLPELLHRLRARQPDLEPRIQVGNTADLLLATADGHVDLALVGSPAAHPALTITPFMHDRLVVIVNGDDPWLGRAAVTLDDLRERTLISRENGSALHASVRELLGADYLASPRIMVLGETEAIKRSVEAGLGIALVPGIAVQREVRQGILYTIPLEKANVTRTYNVVRRIDCQPSSVGQLLLELLLKPPSIE